MFEHTGKLPTLKTDLHRQMFDKHREAFLANEIITRQELEAEFSMQIDAEELLGGDIVLEQLKQVWKPVEHESPYMTALRARIDLMARFPAFFPNILRYPRAFAHAHPLARFRQFANAEYWAASWLVESDDRWPILINCLKIEYAIGCNMGSVPNGDVVTAYTDSLSDYFDSLCCALTGDDLVVALRLAARRNVLPLMHHPGTNLARLPADIARQIVDDLAPTQPAKLISDLREWANDNRYRDKKPRQSKPYSVDESSLLRFRGDWNQIKLASGF